MVLRVYGHIISQPTRAVLSFLRANNIQYELVPINPLRGEHKTPMFKKMNPMSLVPLIEDGEVKLGESAAILTYLHSSRHCPDCWYPKDLVKRAFVDRYLHWHHSNLRRGFLIVLATFPRAKVSDATLNEATTVFNKSLKVLEVLLSRTSYLAGSEVTIADVVAFCELDQHFTMRGLELHAYPKTQEWAAKVGELPGVKDVHEELLQVVNAVRTRRQRAKL